MLSLDRAFPPRARLASVAARAPEAPPGTISESAKLRLDARPLLTGDAGVTSLRFADYRSSSAATANHNTEQTPPFIQTVEVLITTVTRAVECSDVPKRFYDNCYPVATEGDLPDALDEITEELGVGCNVPCRLGLD